jgi:hypothetical protein
MMRYTLDQLKGMSGERLYAVWRSATFPFEMAKCGNCLTQHGVWGCGGISAFVLGTLPTKPASKEHADMQEAVRVLLQGYEHDSPASMGIFLKANLEQLYALRLFYDDLYPRGVPMLPPVTVTTEAPEPVLEPVSVS